MNLERGYSPSDVTHSTSTAYSFSFQRDLLPATSRLPNVYGTTGIGRISSDFTSTTTCYRAYNCFYPDAEVRRGGIPPVTVSTPQHVATIALILGGGVKVPVLMGTGVRFDVKYWRTRAAGAAEITGTRFPAASDHFFQTTTGVYYRW